LINKIKHSQRIIAAPPAIILPLLVVSIFALGSAGCATSIAQQITLLNVDCEANEMQIFNERVALNGEESWTVKCKGRTYDCTYLPESGSSCFEVVEP